MSRKRSLEYFGLLDPDNIWRIEQNKPSLVVIDIKYLYPNIDEDTIYKILLGRGVFKWLAVRRELIKFKDEIKEELTRLYKQVENMQKGTREHREVVGRIKALEWVRFRIREMTHSDRFRAPDNDEKAREFLQRLIYQKKEEDHA